MKKRMLSWLLVLAMVLSMLPAVVLAEGEPVTQSPRAGTHTNAGHSDDCGLTSGWTEWTDSTGLPTQGQIVLMCNVDLKSEITMTGDLTICLNGYVVTAAPWCRIIGTDGSTTLTITDCTAYEDNGVYYAGALTGASYTGSSGGAAFFVRKYGTMKLYDGRITGNLLKNDATATGGGAIMMQDAGSVSASAFYMYGGEISNNRYVKSDGTTGNNGGAIAAGTYCKVFIQGGTVKDNFGGNGSAFWIKENGLLSISGGSFTGNEAQEYGGVADLVNGAKLEISGGSFTGNKANTGGVLNVRANVATISGASFKDNTAKFAGSVIYIYSSANLTIGDGTVITENIGLDTNTGDGWGAAVINGSSGAKVTLTGKVYIAGNTIGGKTIADLNFRQTATDTVYVDGLAEGSFVVFSTPKTKNADANDVVAVSGSQSSWNNGWLVYKNESGVERHVGYENGAFKFVDGHFHGNVEYKPLETVDQLIAGGAYYLTDTFTMDKEAMLNDGATLHLCLNGRKLTTASGIRALSTYGGDKQSIINLDDCTAYYDDQGLYHAGSIEGFHNPATGSGGGAIFIRKNGTLNMYNGRILNNSSKAGGGAMQLTGTANIYGGEFGGNQAPGKDGGAILTVTGSRLTVTGGAFRENSSNNGGAILANGPVTLENVTITGNTAKYAAAIGIQHNSAALVLKDVTVTDNISTASDWCGINVQNNVSIRLEGRVVIQDNLNGSGNQQNIYLCKGVAGVDAAGLTAGSRIGITLRGDRISAGQMYFTTGLAEESYFTSDNDAYTVSDDGSRLILQPAFTHEHCQCGVEGCTDETHSKISYLGWRDSGNLPASGSYCLLTDVELSAEKSVTGDLNLCLHGHKLTANNSRVFSTPGTQVTVNVADCQGTGSMTGKNPSTTAGGGAFFVRANGTVNWYGGSMTGSTTASGGGAALITGTFNLYGGQITGNRAVKSDGTYLDGGALFLDNGSVTNIYGGTISGNVGSRGSAIYAYRAELNIYGGEITGNEAKTEGAIVTNVDVKTIHLSGAPRIVGNTAKGNASNIIVSSSLKLDVGDMEPQAQVAVIGTAFSTISDPCDDHSARFLSDNTAFCVVYKDGALYLEAAGDHAHCLCVGASAQGCDHSRKLFAAWTDPASLPTSGNYYLATDVVLADQTRLTGGSLNLCLNGHTISVADTGNRVFYIRNDAQLSITDCAGVQGRIQNAKASAIMFDGGCDGAALDLYRGEFCDNYSTSAGGAIIIQGKGTFNMYGGLIRNNTSESVLVLDGEGKPQLDETGSQMASTPFGGGGVGTYGGQTRFNMYGGEISGNRAISLTYLNGKGVEVTTGGSGGGVYLRGTMNLYGGRIADNTGLQGGGIMLVSGDAVLNIYGGEICGNYGKAGGGFISQNQSVVNMYGGLITGNSTGSIGGAGGYISTNTTFNMEGGAIRNNYAPNGGAGLYIYNGKANLNDGLITENTTSSQGNGGGIFVAGEGALLTMNGGTVSKYEAQHGAGILVQARGAFVLNGGSVTGNRAGTAGGGMYISINSKFTMTGGNVTYNWAKGYGGGISLYRCEAKVTGGSISYNQGYAAGVDVIGTKATFSGTSFVGNSTIENGHGGALCIRSTSYKEDGIVKDQYTYCTLSGCYIADNRAENGAGIIVMSKGTEFSMYGGTVTGNKAVNGGGGIYLSANTNAKLIGVKITNNESSEGGGVNMFRCSATMEDLLVQGNRSDGYGGGIATRGLYQGTDTLYISNCQILDNYSRGGGVLVQHWMTMYMDGCLVENNSSDGSAGGIYNLYQSISHISNTQIRGNVSTNSGGGLLNTLANWVTLRNCVVENNTSGKYGGGIYNRCRLEVYDSVIQNNTAEDRGGGIGTDGASNELSGSGHGVFLENVKILSNTSGDKGGGAYFSLGCPVRTMKNVVLSGNESGLEGSAIYSGDDLDMIDVEVVGNTSRNAGYAVYVADSKFDGQGYFTGHKQMSGNMIVKDNEGGNLYLGEMTVMAITGQGLGEKSYIQVDIHSGLLTQRVFGTYDYEGGELVYTITPGDRSMTDPELAPGTEDTAEGPGKDTGDVLLYVGIGVVALLAVGAAVLVISKKRSARQAAKQ